MFRVVLLKNRSKEEMSFKAEESAATLMATTSKVEEEIEEDGTRKPVKARPKKGESNSEKMNTLQATVEALKQQIQGLMAEKKCEEKDSLLGNPLIKEARQRLKFDIKDVHETIEVWDHFLKLYGVVSDYEKFYAVEQLLPPYLQRALSSSNEVQVSYRWLVDYLRNKYDPKYLCYEMCNKTANKFTNVNDLEDMATEAANGPKEHLIKHFMLQACSHYQKKKIKPFILLPMREFKFRFKMVLQEEVVRYKGVPENANRRVSAISRNGEEAHDQFISDEEGKPTREVQSTDSKQGNGRA